MIDQSRKRFQIILHIFKLHLLMRIFQPISSELFKLPILILGILISGSLVAHSNGFVSAKITDGLILKDQKPIFGLEINLEKNWKTYWRLPGKIGLKPIFNFNKSENIISAEIIWPTPIIFGDPDLWSIGYKESVTLPIKITPIDNSKPIRLEIEAYIGICEDVCIPYAFDISHSAVSGQNQDNHKILGAILSAPIKSNETGIQLPECVIRNDELTLKFNQKNVHRGLENIDLFVIEVGSSVFFVKSKKSNIFNDRIVVSTEKDLKQELPKVISRDKIRTTIIGSNQSLEFLGCSN